MGEDDGHGRGCHRYSRVVGPQGSAERALESSTPHPILRLPAWAMSRLRPSPSPTLPPSTRPLRVVAVGTLFLTHTLSLPSHPAPAQTIRAHEYVRSRGGSAPSILCVLSQLNADKCWLVASLGGAQDARVVTRELEADGVSTRYCKVWEGAGVPAAWLLHAGEYSHPLGLASLVEPSSTVVLSLLSPASRKETYICFHQATRTASLLSITTHFQTFHTRSLSR
jgi:hypothetical protein